MLYVSGFDGKKQRYAVTDTDDGSVEMVDSGKLFRLVRSLRLRILGVDLSEMSIRVVDRNGNPVKPMTRQEFFEQNAGYDYIMETREGGEFTEYIVSMGGDVLRYRVYGKNGNFQIYEK